jgi:hypothetical protein
MLYLFDGCGKFNNNLIAKVLIASDIFNEDAIFLAGLTADYGEYFSAFYLAACV